MHNAPAPPWSALLQEEVPPGLGDFVVIDSPDDPTLPIVYDRLLKYFRSGEVEPLERFRAELASNSAPGSTASFFAVVLREPGAPPDRPGMGGIYGSVQERVVAVRFKITRPDVRGRGISQAIDRVFFQEAERRADRLGQSLTAGFGECVTLSEGYFNRVWGLRRLYVPEGEGWREFHYELPHLGAWNADGTPLTPEPSPVREHLQLGAIGCDHVMASEVVRAILTSVWEAWYVRPAAEFESETAWHRHRDFILRQLLHERMFRQLEGCTEVRLLSRAERQALRDAGDLITDVDVS